MYKIGDLCPLFFHSRDYIYENTLTYRQKFHTSDRILVEVLSTEEVPTMSAHDLISNTYSNITFTHYEINDSLSLYYAYLSLSDSVYEVSITIGGKVLVSRAFEVCQDTMLLNSTSLIKYSHSSNNTHFDEVFWAGDTELEHQFRVECGFKSNGFQPKVSSESFRTQDQSCRLLYAVPYVVETLTIGTASGVPVWYADIINKIFCLDKVSLNGSMLVRSDGAEVVRERVIDGSQQYVLTIDVESVHESVEGIGGLRQDGVAPAAVAMGVAIEVGDDIAEGSVLQYSKSRSAFIDKTSLE